MIERISSCFILCFIVLLVLCTAVTESAMASMSVTHQEHMTRIYLNHSTAHHKLWIGNGLGLTASIDNCTELSHWLVSFASSKGDIFLTPDFSYKEPVPVAILPFSNDTGDESLGWLSNGIPENMMPKFTMSKSVKLIDSGQINRILDQLGFSSSDMADPESALAVGKLVTARIIVLGSYQKRPGNTLKIIGRLTDVETGTVLKAVQKSGSQGDIDILIEQVSHALVSTIDPNALLVRPMPRPKSRSRAALQSMIWPGWGALPDRKITGILMATLELGAVIGSVLYHLDYEKKLDEYNDARELYSDENKFSSYSEYKAQGELMLSRHEDAMNAKKLRSIFLVSAIIGLRAVGALESAIFTPSAASEDSVVLAWSRRF